MTPNPTPILHITPIENLGSILAAGELRAKRTLDCEGVEYASIAHLDIQSRRAYTQVPCGPGGVLHDYVPFYFGSRSPMLFAHSKGGVAGYDGGQRSIVHFVSTVREVQAAGLEFVFTDGHGVADGTRFYENASHLDKIDWDLIRGRYWKNTYGDPDRKRRRQAEFLVHQRLPIGAVLGIGVIDQHRKAEVAALLVECGLTIPVVVQRDLYH